MPEARVCRVCQVEKPLDGFRRLRSGHHTRMCKPCTYVRCRNRPSEAKDVKSARRKEHYLLNSDRAKEIARNWAKLNPKRKQSQNRARGLKLDGMLPISQTDWLEVLSEQGEQCLACGSPDVTVDHILPISKGGTNVKSNLQPLCAPCNSSKGVSTIDYRRLPC